MALILADCREAKGANPYLPANIAENNKACQKLSSLNGGGELTLKIAQISVGDYIIFLQRTLSLAIERKTWKDLAASIKDGRMDKQLKELTSLKDKTKCQILYIIEGALKYNDDYIINGLPFKNLHAKLRHNVLRGVPYLHSKDEQHTAKIIVDLARDMLKLSSPEEIDQKENKELLEQIIIKDTENCESVKSDDIVLPEELKGKKPMEDEDIILNIWSCLPGVTRKSAIILMEKYHIADIICAPRSKKEQIKNDIAELKFESGTKFGQVKAEKIAELMYDGEDQLTLSRQKDTFLEILTQIPGVSKEIAITILSQYTMKDICAGYIPMCNIADIKKNNGRRIGRVSEKICAILRRPFPI